MYNDVFFLNEMQKVLPEYENQGVTLPFYVDLLKK